MTRVEKIYIAAYAISSILLFAFCIGSFIESTRKLDDMEKRFEYSCMEWKLDHGSHASQCREFMEKRGK